MCLAMLIFPASGKLDMCLNGGCKTSQQEEMGKRNSYIGCLFVKSLIYKNIGQGHHLYGFTLFSLRSTLQKKKLKQKNNCKQSNCTFA